MHKKALALVWYIVPVLAFGQSYPMTEGLLDPTTTTQAPLQKSESARLGVVLIVENDVVFKKDSSYTDGEGLSLQGSGSTNAWGCGIDLRMYTPRNISCPTNQPGDRPWAGITTAFYDWYYVGETGERVKLDLEAGVLGPSSGQEQIQTFVHKCIGSAKPMGWGNQVPNEPVLDVTMERRMTLWTLGERDKWSVNWESLYGGTAGTTFDNLKAGGELRLGWNVPPSWPIGITPKLSYSSWSDIRVYGFAGADGLLVLHNATLGHSFFRRDDDQWCL